MKEAFEMKNVLYRNQNFLISFFVCLFVCFFLAVCYMSSLIGQIDKS